MRLAKSPASEAATRHYPSISRVRLDQDATLSKHPPPSQSDAPAGAAPRRRRRLWRWIVRALFAAFLLVVAFLLYRHVRAVDWRAVVAAIAAYDPGVLALAAGLAVLSHLLYTGYDILARAYAGHALKVRRVMGIAFVSYVFNLNLGAMIGSAGFRLRLYSRYGLRPALIARILAFSVTTNWLGYTALAGCMFLAGAVPVPETWSIGTTGMQVLGFALVAAALGYVALCGASRRREWTIRGHEVRLPSLRLALLQLAVSMANWLTIATLVFVLLQQHVAFPAVLGVFLLAAIAGAITHVPAGLGVMEVVFLTLLEDVVPGHELIAALLVYRAIYYIAPLTVAAALYAGFETRARMRQRRARRD